jgi:site-specific DNA-methyltransferase (adenine-specific)
MQSTTMGCFELGAGERGLVALSDNLRVLSELPDASVELVYIDPPFNTGRVQTRHSLRTERDPEGDRVGFQGERYRTRRLGTSSFADSFDDYLAFLEPRIVEARRVLKPSGSLYFHIDYREVHYCKLLIDGVFGRACFLNEVIWAYDYGARTRRRWPAKHDNILVYVKDPELYYFDTEEMDRIPYMAPGLVSAEKAARGKLPTDTWWHTIVSPTGREKLGYPTQKPLGILERIVRASCPRGGLVLDFFAGSGTAGAAALKLGRRFLLVDENPAAHDVMQRRFAGEAGVRFWAPAVAAP